MEAFGKLFLGNVKLLVYPSSGDDENNFNTCENFTPSENLKLLYKHLYINGYIEDIPNAKVENLHIFSDIVLTEIRKGSTEWEKFVPMKVAETIKQKCMFDYPCKV